MKLIKRISFGTVLLCVSFFAIATCCMIILGAMRTDNLNKLQSRKYYSDNAVTFDLRDFDSDSYWEQWINQYEWNDIAIYTVIWDEERDVRALYGKGKYEHPNMIEGSIDALSEGYANEKRAVVGKNFISEIYEENGDRYISYCEEEYKVVGIMGTEEESRANNSLYIDFASGVNINSINTGYVLDGRDDDSISIVKNDLEQAVLGKGNIDISYKTVSGGVDKIFKNIKTTQGLYSLVLLCFFLSTVIIAALWIMCQKQKVAVKRMLGYKDIYIIFDLGLSYLKIVSVGYVLCLPVVLIVRNNLSAIKLLPSDIFVSFAATVLFGVMALVVPLIGMMRADISEEMK